MILSTCNSQLISKKCFITPTQQINIRAELFHKPNYRSDPVIIVGSKCKTPFLESQLNNQISVTFHCCYMLDNVFESLLIVKSCNFYHYDK